MQTAHRRSESDGQRSSAKRGDNVARFERTLDDILRTSARGGPPRLAEALRHAVFPGGNRLRPTLCLAVAEACGDRGSSRAHAAAAALELVHCASLVHDDLPCFDDADLRRGRPTVHKVYGPATAVLVGDALLVVAFGTLARAGAAQELSVLASATGPGRGIIAGQAWESERAVPLDEYHRAKTASLFEAAAAMGALAAGADPGPWRPFGETIGRAYQAADDLMDAVGTPAEAGKPTRRDAALGRPSLVGKVGVEAARRRLHVLLDAARAGIPAANASGSVSEWVDELATKLKNALPSGA